MSVLAGALHYAAMGYPVLAIVAGAKRPLTPHGLKDATMDSGGIRCWFRRWPHANVAVRTDTIVAIDIDSGATWPPEDLRQAIKAAGPALQRTPRGGWHLIFRLPAGKRWRPRAGALAACVDVKSGPGAYRCVAPSKTPRAVYRWVRPLRRPDCLPLPPAELIDALDDLERPGPRGRRVSVHRARAGASRPHHGGAAQRFSVPLRVPAAGPGTFACRDYHRPGPGQREFCAAPHATGRGANHCEKRVSVRNPLAEYGPGMDASDSTTSTGEIGGCCWHRRGIAIDCWAL